jgi:hypothetical protein
MQSPPSANKVFDVNKEKLGSFPWRKFRVPYIMSQRSLFPSYFANI